MRVPELGSIFYHTSRPVKGRFGPYVQALSKPMKRSDLLVSPGNSRTVNQATGANIVI